MKEQEATHENERDARRASRRKFSKSVAVAVALAPLAPALLVSAQTPTTKEPVAPPNPQPTPSPQRTPQPPSPLAEAYGEVARVRFGDRLSADELARVKRSVAGKVRTADALRNFKLQNSDEPDFVFSA